MYFKFQFVEMPPMEIVGASIARPAHKCYEFAQAFGEFVPDTARTGNARPYIDFRNLSDKLKLTRLM